MWELQMQVGLHCEMRVIQTMEVKQGFLLSGSFPHKVFVSVTVIALPISLCCQSFIGIPMTYIQYNPANSHFLGEYKFKVEVNRVSS